jgi:hypothetical protein
MRDVINSNANPRKHITRTIQFNIPSSLSQTILLFLTEHHVMQAYWGRRGIAPRILDLGNEGE